MNSSLMVAGFLTVLMAVAHSVMGERLILRPLARQIQTTPNKLLQSRLPTLRFTWHITSILGLAMAWLFFDCAQQTNLAASHITLLRTSSIAFLLCFGVALIGSRAKHPSWLVFLIIAGLTWLSTT
ncbi:hypothetical protein [Herpetosiphon giganteus]|uniref:hypothetical protein n=1 Tax=Herpetosiphon giganteus TaxID=2029754 RepID=UPI001956FB36|nr:hypothetical protein [Herpetosiphon giganteus]MBM7842590.1 putative membrane protein [Herpetosiphon giganteus]